MNDANPLTTNTYSGPAFDDAVLGGEQRRIGIGYEDVTDDPGLKLLHRAPATLDEEPSYYFTDRRGSVWRAYRI